MYTRITNDVSFRSMFVHLLSILQFHVCVICFIHILLQLFVQKLRQLLYPLSFQTVDNCSVIFAKVDRLWLQNLCHFMIQIFSLLHFHQCRYFIFQLQSLASSPHHLHIFTPQDRLQFSFHLNWQCYRQKHQLRVHTHDYFNHPFHHWSIISLYQNTVTFIDCNSYQLLSLCSVIQKLNVMIGEYYLL